MDEEQTLLARARRLDPEALAAIHDSYYPLIYRFVAFRTGDRSAAEDLASEVFTRFLSALRDRSAPPRTLRSWLFAVAAHIVSDYHRRRYRAPQVELDDRLQSDDAGPDERLDDVLQSQNLRRALAELTEDQQNVIALRFGQGLAISEVSRMLGKSEGAIKQMQARALAMLARKLNSRSDEP